MKKRLGEILLERQLLTVDQLNTALAHQRQWNMRLGAALVAKGFITERDLTHVLAESLGIPLVDLSKIVVDTKAMQAVPVEICEQHDLFPIALKQQKGRPFLVLAMADPLNFGAIDEISFSTGCKVQPAIALLSSVGQAIRRFYYEQRTVVITPLEGETPLSRSGRPISAPTAAVDGPPHLVTNAEFMADFQPPEVGGPGQAPADTAARPPTGAGLPSGPMSGGFSVASIPGMTPPALPQGAPRSGSFSAAVAIRGVTAPSLPAAPPAPRMGGNVALASRSAASSWGRSGSAPDPDRLAAPAPPAAMAPTGATPSAAATPQKRAAATQELPVIAPPDAPEDDLDELPIIELTSEAETGTFLIASPSHDAPSLLEAPADTAEPQTLKALAASETESLEEKFWALMHVLNARGVVTKEEFLAQLRSRR